VLQLVYEDNGIGFDAENVNRGIGLDSINSRIEMVSGSLEFDQSERKTGITAFIRIPLKTKTA
jgi:signal transduction histidine kinase